MGSIHAFNPVKLFAGILVASEDLIPGVESQLCSRYGDLDHRSPILPFTFTDYYQKETGDHILRVFFSFETLIDAARLPEIKNETNVVEEQFAAASPFVKRPVNLDPGYLENSKIVLASTKNFYHRTYLNSGIFAEVTMHFRAGGFQFFPWTYPDYQSPEYQRFFLEVRGLYRKQLRQICLLRK
jgi:hypothetical protein